jgi:hypothetical protein
VKLPTDHLNQGWSANSVLCESTIAAHGKGKLTTNERNSRGDQSVKSRSPRVSLASASRSMLITTTVTGVAWRHWHQRIGSSPHCGQRERQHKQNHHFLEHVNSSYRAKLNCSGRLRPYYLAFEEVCRRFRESEQLAIWTWRSTALELNILQVS